MKPKHTEAKIDTAPSVGFGALLAEAAHSQMPLEKAMQLAEDFCKHEAWGLDFWREPMTVLAAEVARLRSANVEDWMPIPSAPNAEMTDANRTEK